MAENIGALCRAKGDSQVDDLAQFWNNLPDWAKIALPLGVVAIILLIWQPWKKNTSSAAIATGSPPSEGGAGGSGESGVSPSGSGKVVPLQNFVSPKKTPAPVQKKVIVPGQDVTLPSSALPKKAAVHHQSLPATTTVNLSQASTAAYSEPGVQYTQGPSDTGQAVSYAEKVLSPSAIQVTKITASGTQTYTQPANTLFNLLHNPVGAPTALPGHSRAQIIAAQTLAQQLYQAGITSSGAFRNLLDHPVGGLGASQIVNQRRAATLYYTYGVKS